jgi:hypothetical protein
VPAGAGTPLPRYQLVRYALDGSAKTSAPQELTGAEVLVPAVASLG